jgi:hypothetical protein
LILSVFVAGCLACFEPVSSAVKYAEIKRVDEPAALPYRFHESWQSPQKDSPEIYIPLYSGTDSIPFTCVLQSDWLDHETLSSILFFSDISITNAVNQVNIKGVDRLVENLVSDFDGDNTDEIAVTFMLKDSLWLLLADRSEGIIYKRFLSTGEDRNRNGSWDARGYLKKAYDFNDDGNQEILVATITGYDLYPRVLHCVDFAADSILWEYEVGGIIAEVHLVDSPYSKSSPYLVFGSHAVANGAEANGMDDLHSYLLALDSGGNELWRRQISCEYTTPLLGLLDYGSDGSIDVVTGFRYCHNRDSVGQCVEWGGAYKVFDLSGSEIDSSDLGVGREVLWVTSSDIEGDGVTEVLFSVADSSILRFDNQMNLSEVCRFYTSVRLWGALDIVTGNGKELLAVTGDMNLWLLDPDYHPLAQFSGAGQVSLIKPFVSRTEHLSYELIVSPDLPDETHYLSLEKTPWFFIFYREPELAFFAAFLPMTLIVAVIGFHSYTVRRKNRIISHTRDQLQETLEELKDTQEKLIEAEKHKQMKFIAGGVAHEIHNALLSFDQFLLSIFQFLQSFL